MNKCPLFFVIPEVWGLNEGNMHSPKRDHDDSLQCESACCDYWSFMGRSGGNWRSLRKRNPAKSASGKPLSCKFLEAGKVFRLNITKCLFLACINSQASPWSLLRPTGWTHLAGAAKTYFMIFRTWCSSLGGGNLCLCSQNVVSVKERLLRPTHGPALAAKLHLCNSIC